MYVLFRARDGFSVKSFEGDGKACPTLTVPLHKQGRISRPRSGSGPSRHILH